MESSSWTGRTQGTDGYVMLGLQDTVYKLARASMVHCYGHALRSDEDDVLRWVLDFKVN